MPRICLLWHLHGPAGDDPELVGAYSSRARAYAAVRRLRDQPGFRDAPDLVDDDDLAGFFVADVELDVDHWRQGHVSGADHEVILVDVPATPDDAQGARPPDVAL